ncbi:kinase-like protein, partial [Teratosphaeria nubilosa]
LSEAEIIEQRRKRREAIKARHGKSQAPLLVQALEQNMQSAPATPAHESSGATSEQQSPPSSLDSPSTPQRDSPPASPAAFTVNDDEELANRHQGNTVMHEDDGPSAADYDPNMDLQEDRPDHKRSGVEAPMLDAVEVAENQAPAKASKEFDMFADDDDEDMFAPTDTAARAPATGLTKAAKALDQSLLDNWDYPDGHYRIILGELLNARYAVQQQVGKGTFATVVRALDNQTGNPVAIKIAANNETMYKAGQKEMDFLAILNQNDVEDKKHIIRLLRHFDHKGHMCIVFEALSADLREVLKKFGRNVGLNLKAIRSYAQQMFLALGHMKKCNILHADLKPDNILVSEKRNLLKVCDLGTAAFADDTEITPYLVSRFYRAPEVILGMPFDYAIDMWSIGCTLFELYTGRILFAGADNNQMLRVIQECRGKFPIRMLKRSTLAEKHFDFDGNFFSQERDKITGKTVVRQVTFRDRGMEGKDLRARLAGNAKGLAPAESKEHASFVDLLEKCLQVDPARRITPADAMRHAFVSHGAEVSKESAKPKVVPAMGGILPKKR